VPSDPARPAEPAGPAGADFAAAAEPYRPELLAHCYRMLGSLHDAEDLVQETYLRAWRGFGQFEGRSSVRRWLYTIATRVCLTALETRERRPLPSGLGAPSEDHRIAVAGRDASVPWLQPVPDALLGPAGSGDPAVVAAARAGVRLAFIAALQLLPARQRAILTLHDVLAFSTSEVAALLGTSPAAVDSALRRARARLARAGAAEENVTEPTEAAQRALLEQYVDAFTRADPAALIRLLRADVELEMPPVPTWFTGQQAVAGFLATRVMRPGRWRMQPTTANTQPALVVHHRGGAGSWAPYGVQVLALTGTEAEDGSGVQIARIVSFNDPALVPAFAASPPTQPDNSKKPTATQPVS
jgi:RNA polymerase sigma-70 factor (TIGR02960 family)